MANILDNVNASQTYFKSKLEQILPKLLENSRGVPFESNDMLFPLAPESEGWYLRHPLGGTRVFSNLVKPWANSFWIDVSTEDVLEFAAQSYIRSAVIAHNAYKLALQHPPFSTPKVLKEYENERQAHDRKLSAILEPLIEFTADITRAAEVMCGAYHLFPGIMPNNIQQDAKFFSVKGSTTSFVNNLGANMSEESFNEWVRTDPLRLTVVIHNLYYHAKHPYIGNPM